LGDFENTSDRSQSENATSARSLCVDIAIPIQVRSSKLCAKAMQVFGVSSAGTVSNGQSFSATLTDESSERSAAERLCAAEVPAATQSKLPRALPPENAMQSEVPLMTPARTITQTKVPQKIATQAPNGTVAGTDSGRRQSSRTPAAEEGRRAAAGHHH
jgi:hypothetical protein